MGSVDELAGRTALVLDAGGDALDGRSFRDAVMEALSEGASLLVVPAARLDPAFFDLRSGVAGDLLQVSVVYGMPLAVVGALPEPALSSGAFAALVRESNAGSQHWFVPDLDALRARIERA